MDLGFNSRVQLPDARYDVQTEDRGSEHPFIDTLVLSKGRVVYRRSASYQDLLDSGMPDPTSLRARVERQHAETLEALRNGTLAIETAMPANAGAIEVRLENPESWLAAGKASIEVLVRSSSSGQPVEAAEVEVSIEGAEEGPSKFSARTDAAGHASFHFPLPQLTPSADAALLIQARTSGAQNQLRYHLKAKPVNPKPEH
jgi:hypothetical protein